MLAPKEVIFFQLQPVDEVRKKVTFEDSIWVKKLKIVFFSPQKSMFAPPSPRKIVLEGKNPI